MAFVIESMGESGSNLIKSLNLLSPVGSGHKYHNEFRTYGPEEEWAIDHKRNLQFFVVWGIGFSDREQPPLTCCLVWDGKPAIIEAYSRQKGNNSLGIEEIWEIERISVPSILKDIPEDVIVEAVKEAFIAYAHRRKRNVKSVEFASIPKVIY